MYIRTVDIPGEGLDVPAAKGTKWVPGVLEGVDPYPLESWRMVSAELFLTMEGRDVFAEGAIAVEGEALCDRCTEAVPVRLAGTFHTVLVPKEEESGLPKVELHEEDLEVAYYDGVGIEVADILREQAALALPSKVLCRDDCRGICPACGANRNREECSCREETGNRPFDVLKNLKGKKE